MDKLTPFTFLLFVLAIYRLAMLVSQDILTAGIRNQLGKRVAGKPPYSLSWYLAELINCPYCTGVWIALVCAFLITNEWQEWIVIWLALAGGQAFLHSLGRR